MERNYWLYTNDYKDSNITNVKCPTNVINMLNFRPKVINLTIVVCEYIN